MKKPGYLIRLSICAALLSTGSASLSASTLRVLIIGDTNDRSIGKSVVTDIVNFEQFMRDAASKAGMELDLTILKGNQIKSRLITEAVSNLKAETDDAVVFYYSGHGFRTKQVTTRWPLLYIPDAGTKGVDFQWVIDTLNKKNPRMILAISDSCNSFIDTPADSVNGRAMRVAQDAAWKKLFAEFSGRIYASGSQVGQYSFGQDATGGAFTSRFLGIVRGETTNTNPSWDNIMKLATRQIQINSPQQKTQDPQYELVKGMPTQTPQGTVETHEVQPAHQETSEEHNEQCKALTEFQTALASVKDTMPPKVDFSSDGEAIGHYQTMVTALVQAGGDKQMINLAKSMDQGLRMQNWSRFRSSVWAYERHVTKLQKKACSAN